MALYRGFCSFLFFCGIEIQFEIREIVVICCSAAALGIQQELRALCRHRSTTCHFDIGQWHAPVTVIIMGLSGRTKSVLGFLLAATAKSGRMTRYVYRYTVYAGRHVYFTICLCISPDLDDHRATKMKH